MGETRFVPAGINSVLFHVWSSPRALGAGGNHRKLASRHRQRAPLQSNKLSHGRIASATLQITFCCDEAKVPAKLVEMILEYNF